MVKRGRRGERESCPEREAVERQSERKGERQRWKEKREEETTWGTRVMRGERE